MRTPRSIAWTLVLLAPVIAMAQVDDEGCQHLQLFPTLPGSAATGLGGAFIGLADDASAAISNPAGLMTLEGRELRLELARDEQTVDMLAGQLSLLDLEPTPFDSEVTRLHLASFAQAFERWSLAFFYHRGLDLDLSYLLHERPLFGHLLGRLDRTVGRLDLASEEYGVAVAFATGRVNWGVNLRLVSLALESATEHPYPAALGWGERTSVADRQTGWAGTIGLLVPVTGTLDLGLVYGSNPRFEFGDHRFEWDEGGEVAGVVTVDSSLALPSFAGLGASWRPAERWTVIADVHWLELERVFDSSQTVYPYFEPLVEGRLDMDDRFELHTGAEYTLPMASGPLAFRAGWLVVPERRLRYDSSGLDGLSQWQREMVEALQILYNSQPEETLHGFSAGLAWTWHDRLEVSAAYSRLEDVFSRASLGVAYRF
jgi:hypothetical protein